MYAGISSSFENFLGEFSGSTGVFSLQRAERRDEAAAYPLQQVETLNEWGLYHYFIPTSLDGKLNNLCDMFCFMKLLARRDLSVAITYGGTLLGAAPIWVGGSDALKSKVASDIRCKKKIAFALTEKAHGSDLLSTEMFQTFHQETGDYMLDGSKWLFNHATKSDYITILAKEQAIQGPRSCSLFYMPASLEGNNSAVFSRDARIATVGLRGLDLGGISLRGYRLSADAMIGNRGAGLELALTGMQVTKTLCAALSLGSMDTILRCVVSFSIERILYRRPILAIPIVRRKLVSAFVDLTLSECLTIFACRVAQQLPNQFGLIASVVKSFVPTMVEMHTKELASVLGARSFVIDDSFYAAFQKQARDNAIISIFDGNTYVNQQYILQQVKMITALSHLVTRLEKCKLQEIFSMKSPLPCFDFSMLELTGKGRDILSESLQYIVSEISMDDHESDRQLLSAARELEDLIVNFYLDFASIDFSLNSPFLIEARAFKFAENYAKMCAATAALGVLFVNRRDFDDTTVVGCLLRMCVEKINAEIKGIDFQCNENDEKIVLDFMMRCVNDALLFSPFRMPVCR